MPETNTGSGVIAQGAVDYRDWCVTASCLAPIVPTVKATTTLRAKTRTQHDGDLVLVVRVSADTASVDGGTVAISKAGGKRVALLVVHRGKVHTNLGTMRPGKHVYNVEFRSTDTANGAVKRVVVRVR